MAYRVTNDAAPVPHAPTCPCPDCELDGPRPDAFGEAWGAWLRATVSDEDGERVSVVVEAAR